ncbi:MAG: hypothetical protein JW816_00685 [Candidatus Buchananbacteria bacterium]|nr:hypothetical protein [Candidatus Buchananbacteria bacterium]
MPEGETEMKYNKNEETRKVLHRSGLEWLVPLLSQRITSFKVELIDLDVLSRGPNGVMYGEYFRPLSQLFLFDGNGQKIVEVGGKGTISRDEWTFSLFQWPPLRRSPVLRDWCYFETVENALRRLSDKEVNSIRFIVDVPNEHGSSEVRIWKLRRNDKNLRTRIREKADEAVSEIKAILEG